MQDTAASSASDYGKLEAQKKTFEIDWRNVFRSGFSYSRFISDGFRMALICRLNHAKIYSLDFGATSATDPRTGTMRWRDAMMIMRDWRLFQLKVEY